MPDIGAAAGSAEELAGPPGVGPASPWAATESADAAIGTWQPAEKNEDLKPQEIIAAPTGQAASVPPGATRASSLGLAELARSLGVNLPPALAGRNVETGADLLASHARGQYDSLPPRDRGPVEDLVAHAALSTIGADAGHRAILMASGYRAPADLAAAGRDEFVRSVSAGLGAAEARRIHAAATAQAMALGAVQTAARVERVRPGSPLGDSRSLAPGRCGSRGGLRLPGLPGSDEPAGLPHRPAALRHCPALIRRRAGYRRGSRPAAPAAADRASADCGTSERDVNQVRLVAESLLRVIQAAFDEEPAGVADRYTWTAYQALLTQLGTSYQELRQVRGQPTAERQALTDRLGLHWDGTRPDVLDALLMTPGTVSLDGLEELFGLVSTRRDPLSDGLVRGSSAAQVRRWHLAGAEWSADPACSSTSRGNHPSDSHRKRRQPGVRGGLQRHRAHRPHRRRARKPGRTDPAHRRRRVRNH